MMLPLSKEELLRYNRQISLKGFDIDKQQLLKNCSALIIGVGGLGCGASLYLTNAGIGQLTIVDFDTISESNLNRQILYTENSIGLKKVIIAKQTLAQYNSQIKINTISHTLNDNELQDLISHHHVVLDCSDNLATRLQINRCCHKLKKPLISASAIRMEGILSVFTFQEHEPCYQCLSQLFKDEQLSCVESGIMAPLVGVMGTMQALEAIKIITHYGTPLVGRVLVMDALSMQFNELKLLQQANCPICQYVN
nr:molybdopterin-synthase adenylyltransferase MoeB [Frischella perrara]